VCMFWPGDDDALQRSGGFYGFSSSSGNYLIAHKARWRDRTGDDGDSEPIEIMQIIRCFWPRSQIYTSLFPGILVIAQKFMLICTHSQRQHNYTDTHTDMAWTWPKYTNSWPTFLRLRKAKQSWNWTRDRLVWMLVNVFRFDLST